MTVAIVDYGVGNVGSLVNMIKKAGSRAAATSDPQTLLTSEHIILPGVGAFDRAMDRLTRAGLVEVLEQAVHRGIPLLGVCLGMQLLTAGSEEGALPGLGFIDARTVKITVSSPEATALRVPHMGWNRAVVTRPHRLFEDLQEGRFYFLHSYVVKCTDEHDVIANTEYGVCFASAIGRGSVMGVQFHPEKSHRFGMQLLANFCRYS